MNSLFVKTLLWFLGTAALTGVAVVVFASLNLDDDEPRRPALQGMVRLHMREARDAYETGGPAALAEKLRRFREATGIEAALTDSRGRDLATGQDRSAILADPRGHGWIVRGNPRYRFLINMPRRRDWLARWFPPQQFAVMGVVIALLCWGFARYLTNPVRHLQTAMEAFGGGDLSRRVPVTRNDELGRVADSFNAMADRIGTLLAAERRLLGDISHELRSPLARLNLAIELARTEENPAEHLDRIQKEADRLNALVGELLQVTRAEGDPSQLRAGPVDLAALSESIVADARIEAEARGSGIDFKCHEPATVQADGELLRRAVENVVRNGLRYEPAGSNLEVRVDGARIRVRDHGPGVPPESLGRIFDPFYRVESHRGRDSGGVGLGLAIAKRALALHKGSIDARNANPGLEVTITLPA